VTKLRLAKCQCGSDRIEIRSTFYNPGKGKQIQVRTWLECDVCRGNCPSVTVGGSKLANELIASWNDQQEENRSRWTR
jgi:hypothetical protein